MQQYLLQITSGVITMVKSILNFIIGIIVVVYVLSIKESLVGQSKKIVYAIFKPNMETLLSKFSTRQMKYLVVSSLERL